MALVLVVGVVRRDVGAAEVDLTACLTPLVKTGVGGDCARAMGAMLIGVEDGG